MFCFLFCFLLEFKNHSLELVLEYLHDHFKVFCDTFLSHQPATHSTTLRLFQSMFTAILYPSSLASIVLTVDSLDRLLWMRDVSHSASEKVHPGIKSSVRDILPTIHTANIFCRFILFSIFNRRFLLVTLFRT